MAFEIEQTLVLSTGHICHGTSEMIDEVKDDDSHGLVWDYDEYGWRFLCLKNHVDSLILDKQAFRSMPDLHRLVMLAQDLDCKWLRLDCEGPKQDSLYKYEW